MPIEHKVLAFMLAAITVFIPTFFIYSIYNYVRVEREQNRYISQFFDFKNFKKQQKNIRSRFNHKLAKKYSECFYFLLYLYELDESHNGDNEAIAIIQKAEDLIAKTDLEIFDDATLNKIIDDQHDALVQLIDRDYQMFPIIRELDKRIDMLKRWKSPKSKARQNRYSSYIRSMLDYASIQSISSEETVSDI